MEQLSKTAQKILIAAYDHYLETSDTSFTWHLESTDDLSDVTLAIHQLRKNHYICDVATYVMGNDVIVVQSSTKSTSFSITIDGIAAAQTNREP